eukprot:957405_1
MNLQRVIAMVTTFIFTVLFGWFIGARAMFYNLCGMPANYTRKIGHFMYFVFPIVAAGGIDGFIESETSAYVQTSDLALHLSISHLIYYGHSGWLRQEFS